MSDLVKSLRVLSEEAREILNVVEDAQGELDSSIELYLDLVQKNIRDKVDSYDFVLRRAQEQEEALDERIKELQALKKHTVTFYDRLKGRIIESMRILDVKELSGSIATFKVYPSGKSKLVLDESKLEESHFKQVTELVPDKEQIRALLEEGRPIDGASLVQSFVLKNVTTSGKLLK